MRDHTLAMVRWVQVCTCQTLIPTEAGPPEGLPLTNSAVESAAFLLSDIAAHHLYRRDGWWVPLTELGSRKRRGRVYIPLGEYLEVKEDLLLFGSFAEAEAARMALVTRNCHTRVLQVLPGESRRSRSRPAVGSASNKEP